jgi:hypothetical protein
MAEYPASVPISTTSFACMAVRRICKKLPCSGEIQRGGIPAARASALRLRRISSSGVVKAARYRKYSEVTGVEVSDMGALLKYIIMIAFRKGKEVAYFHFARIRFEDKISSLILNHNI